MKKSMTLVLALVFCVAAKAQTTKDYYIIGGNLSNISLDFQESNTVFGLNIVPRAAWFIQDNFAIGGEVLIGLKTGDGFTTTNYGIGPIARYYLSGNALESVGKTRWFVDGNVGFYGQNTKVTGMESASTNGLGIGFGPGLAYFINKNIALEALAKYNLTVGFGNSTTNNGLNIGLGLQIYLPKSKLRSLENDIK